MIRKILAAAFVSCVAIGTVYPVATADAAGTVGNYHSYWTDHPRQGFVGVGRRSGYCDYIKYPVKDCRYRRVCRRGRCWTRPSCRVVGWNFRQTCY